MSSFEFTTEKLVEESTVIWKIPDFTKLHETKSPKKGRERLQFTAGGSLHQPSTWSLQLLFATGNDIGLVLHLEKCPESVESVNMKYSASANYPTSEKELQLVPSKETEFRAYTTSNGAWGWITFLTLDELGAARIPDHLYDDTLTIHVKMVINGEVLPTTPVCSEEMLKQNALNRISKHFPELLKTGECSDLVIRVKEEDSGEYIEKKVHRIILSAQSPVFEVMLGSPMSEKETGIVTIEDLTPKGLDVLLEFIYTGNIPDDWKLIPEEIVNAAEKYNLSQLKMYIGERLHEACTPENAVSLFNLAEDHGLPDKNILQYIKSNLKNVLKKI